MNVNAVQQRAGDFGDVALDHGRRTHALAAFVVEVAAGAGVHGRGQHETRGEAKAHAGAGDSDVAVFERLAKNLQDIAGELRKLIQEEKTVVRQRDLAGARDRACEFQKKLRQNTRLEHKVVRMKPC